MVDDNYTYYEKYFPVDLVQRFYELTSPISHREWGLGVYKRTHAPNIANLRDQILNAIRQYRHSPEKYMGDYHAGPTGPSDLTTQWMPCRPRKETPKDTGIYMPPKEWPIPFVIDVDISDYAEIRRHCGCGNAKECVCHGCWGIVPHAVSSICTRIAEEVVSRENRDIFSSVAWDHGLWVASGRRGIHAHYVDPQYALLNPLMRSELTTHASLPANIEEIPLDPETSPLETLYALHGMLPGDIEIDRHFLDEHVSNNPIHLTRGIFSIHQHTGRIALPMHPWDLIQCNIEETQINVADLVAGVPRAVNRFKQSMLYVETWLSKYKMRNSVIKSDSLMYIMCVQISRRECHKLMNVSRNQAKVARGSSFCILYVLYCVINHSAFP